MSIHWKAHKLHACEDGKARTVYIKGEFAPFVGWIATADSAFSVAAYVRISGKRCTGYVDETPTFRPLNSHSHMIGIRNSSDDSRSHRVGRFYVNNVKRYSRENGTAERKLDIQSLQVNGAQLILRDIGHKGWFQVVTFLPGYPQERQNHPRAVALDILRRWRAQIPALKLRA